MKPAGVWPAGGIDYRTSINCSAFTSIDRPAGT
jgi:hypothetical protein